MWPLVGVGVAVARNVGLSTDSKPIPELALCHHAGCIEGLSARIRVNGAITTRWVSW